MIKHLQMMSSRPHRGQIFIKLKTNDEPDPEGVVHIHPFILLASINSALLSPELVNEMSILQTKPTTPSH